MRKAVLYALVLIGVSAFVVSGEDTKDYMGRRKVIVDTLKTELRFVDERKRHPVLIGRTTSKGTFSMNIYRIDEAGYGGDVIGFRQEKDSLFTLHRVWTLKPSKRRTECIISPVVPGRVIIGDCIDVTSDMYNRLKTYFVLEVT